MADDIPNGFPDGFWRGFVLAGAESGGLIGLRPVESEPPSGAE